MPSKESTLKKQQSTNANWIDKLPKKYQAEAISQLRKAEARATALSKSIRQAQAKQQQAETELMAMVQAQELRSATETKFSAKKFAKPRAGKAGRNATAIVVATDWHLGETIATNTVNDMNEFNLSVAQTRINRLWERAAFLVNFSRSFSPITEVAILFLGDMISGVIHPDLEQTNDIAASEAIVLAQDYMAAGIDHLRAESKLPIRVGCCVGNHGRMSHEKYIKAEWGHSLEAIAYQNLAHRYAKHEWCHIDITKGYLGNMEVQGRKIRYHHGHAVRYMQGIGGPAIPLRKKIAAWNVAQSPAHQDILGHLHMRLSDPRFEIVGCLVGYSEFAIRCGIPYEPPTQGFFVIDEKWGKVLSMPIHLEETPRFPAAY